MLALHLMQLHTITLKHYADIISGSHGSFVYNVCMHIIKYNRFYSIVYIGINMKNMVFHFFVSPQHTSWQFLYIKVTKYIHKYFEIHALLPINIYCGYCEHCGYILRVLSVLRVLRYFR